MYNLLDNMFLLIAAILTNMNHIIRFMHGDFVVSLESKSIFALDVV